MEKTNLILIILNEENLFYYLGSKRDYIKSENFEEFLEEHFQDIKDIYIFLSDNNIFIDKFEINVSKSSEAKSAAINMLLINNVKNNSEITYKKVFLEKESNKFIATVFYTYLNLEFIFENLRKKNLEKNLQGIFPLFQLFYDKKDFCYSLKDKYYTIIENQNNIAIYGKLTEDKLSKYNVKTVDINELGNYFQDLKVRNDLNFIDLGKYEVFEKFFIPAIVFILIINIALLGFLKIKNSKLEKKLDKIKNQVNIEIKSLQPYQEAYNKNEQLKRILLNVEKFKNASFPFNELVKNLSLHKRIWIRQITLNYNRLTIYGKAESAYKVVEDLKKLSFLENIKISSKIIRDNNGFERFTIRANFKNAFKN
jgi:hypothetical protein